MGARAIPPGRTLTAGLGTVAAFLLLFQVLYWDRIMPGVRALDVSLGGLSREAAEEQLRKQAADLLDRPLTLVAGDQEYETTPRQLGLTLDVHELGSKAMDIGRTGPLPGRLLEQFGALFFGRELSLLDADDIAALEASLRRWAGEIDRPAREARLSVDPDYRPVFTPAAEGLELDVPASAQVITDALTQRRARAELVMKVTRPTVTDDLLQPARRELETMLAGPFTLKFQDLAWTLERSEIARLLSLEIRPGVSATVRVDADALRQRIEQIAEEIDREPRNARFAWTQRGLVPLVESQDGRALDVDQAVALVLERLRAGERHAELPVRITPPAVATTDADRLGIRELIDQGKTSYAGSTPEKKHNIELAAQRLNGVVVPAGGLFSFNKEVGPTTLEAGFKWGFGITSAGDEVRTVPSVAGGICQVATTLFQPVFWSGYPLEERHWHLYWIPAYTSRGVVGLDVTVDEEAGLDFKFMNPTPHALLIQAWTANDELHFALYGQKPDWRVEVDPPVITNRVPPEEEMVYEAEPSLPWGRRLQVEVAREGFDVQITRRVISGGDVRTLVLKSSYRPSRNVTLVGTKGAPAGADVQAVLARLRESQSSQNKPVRGEGELVAPPRSAAQTPTPAPPPATPSPAAQTAPSPTLGQTRTPQP